MQGDKDFPPAAVKSYHEKPLPTHDNRPPPNKAQIIQQPRWRGASELLLWLQGTPNGPYKKNNSSIFFFLLFFF